MPALEHSRYRVYSKSQHPLNHNMSEFLYNNPAAPGVVNIEDAMNFIFNVLYPQTKETVDWPTEAEAITAGGGATWLPLTGNNAGDYRNVTSGHTEDGGTTYKTAGYMWAQYDGDDEHEWKKTTVFDWGTDDIASVMVDRTKLLYYFKQGLNDVDENGDSVTGDLAGQSLYGGQSVGTNLTLNANNGDDTGHSGYIQLNDDTVPLQDSQFILGEIAKRFKEFYADYTYSRELKVGFDTGYELTISTTPTKAVISHNQNNIDFGVANLTTGGIATIAADIEIRGGVIRALTSSELKFYTVGTNFLDIAAKRGSFTDLLIDGDLTINPSTISSSVDAQDITISTTNADIVLDSDSVVTKDIVPAGDSQYDIGAAGNEFASAHVDALRTGDINTTSGDLRLGTNGIGDQIFLDAEAQTINLKTTGLLTVDGRLKVDQLTFDANSIDSSSGGIVVNDRVLPNDDGDKDLGEDLKRFKDGYFTGKLDDGAGSIIEASEWGSLRYVNYEDIGKVATAATGQILVRDVSGFLVSSEIDAAIAHADLGSLTSDDHSQYALLAGRSGGQIISGGVVNTENLILRGYAGGRYWTIDDNGLIPNTDGVVDLGASSTPLKDIFAKGELKFIKLENTSGTFPTVGQIGHLVYDTTANAVFVDTGAEYQRVGGRSCKGTFTQTELLSPINVSQASGHANLAGYVDDARDAIWQLKDSTGEVLGVTITVTQTTVTISNDIPLPADNYRLVGVEA